MKPPRHIPPHLIRQYTMDYRVGLEEMYLDGTQTESETRVFRADEIAPLMEKATRREINYYGETDRYLYQALDNFGIAGKECVIMGTQVPWYESICLVYGAKSCTTIEYWRIRFEHEQLHAVTPDQYEKNPQRFERGFSISSFEHDGLGRYGDPLNPDGDLEAMRRMKQIIAPGGLLYLAVPVAVDKLVWNAHRIYGSVRLPKLLEGWRIVGAFGFGQELLTIDTGENGPYQPVFVLENI